MGGRSLKLLERRGVGYVVKMRANSSVSLLLYGLGPTAWRRIPFEGDGEIESGDFSFQRDS